MESCGRAAEEGKAVSVLIKGMEMPTHCTECDFWHDGVFEHCLLNMEVQNEDVPFNEGEYPDGCPLVEIPPHGRLGDADKLADSFEPSDFWNPDAEDNCFAAVRIVHSALTIIPAEEARE